MWRRLSAVVALAGGLALLPACAEEPDPITVRDNMVSVVNLTEREWRNVLVTVNDHYNGGAPSLAPGGRLTAPLSQFQTGYGQRFPWERTRVFKVEVTATDAAGERIKLQWGQTPKATP